MVDTFEPSEWFDDEGKATQSGDKLRQTLKDEFSETFELVSALPALYEQGLLDPDEFSNQIKYFRGKAVVVAKRQKVEQTPKQAIEVLLQKYGADNAFMSIGTKSAYLDRRVESQEVELLPRPNHLHSLLTIITGSSGSGKTWFMIHCKKREEVAVYMTPADFAEGWKDEHWDVEDQDPERGDKVARCNEAAKAVFLAAIERCLPKEICPLINQLRQSEPQCALLIAVDELGYKPNFLRALCANHGGMLEQQIQDRLKIDVPIIIVAGGTGTNLALMNVGSHPEKFQVLPVPATLQVWEALVTEGKRKGDKAVKAFFDVLRDNATATELARNPRVAAIIYNKLCGKGKYCLQDEFWAILGDDPFQRAIESVLPEFFAGVAKTFRTLNSMSNVNSQLLWELYRAALGVVMFPTLVMKYFDNGFVPMLHQLIALYGVLEDTAYWSEQSRSSADVKTAQGGANYYLWIPPQRYVMPRAQVQLFRLGYGLQIGGTTMGGGSFAQFLEVILLASSGIVPLTHVLWKLGMSEEKKMEESWARPLEYPGVKSVRSNIKVEPKNLKSLLSGSAWHVELKALLEQGHAVILSNAPKAAFADLIVFIPGRAVVLVQAKYFFREKSMIDSSFTKSDVSEELWKMGCDQDSLFYDVFANNVGSGDLPEQYQQHFDILEGPLTTHLIAHVSNQDLQIACSKCNGLNTRKDLPLLGTTKKEMAAFVQKLSVKEVEKTEFGFQHVRIAELLKAHLGTHLTALRGAAECAECAGNGLYASMKLFRSRYAANVLVQSLCDLATKQSGPAPEVFWVLATTTEKDLDLSLPARVMHFAGSTDPIVVMPEREDRTEKTQELNSTPTTVMQRLLSLK